MHARFPFALSLCLLCARAARAEGSRLPDGHLDTAVVREAYLRSDIPFVRSALESYLRNHPKDVPTAEKVFTHLYLGAAFAGDPEGRGRSEAHFRAALKFAPDADPSGLYLPPAALAWFESLRSEVRSARPASPAPPSGTPASTGANGGAPSALASAPAPTSATDPAAASAPATATAPASTSPSASPPGTADGNAAGTTAEGTAGPAGGPHSTGSGPGPATALAPERSRRWIWWAVGGGAAVAAGASAFAWIESRSGASPHRVQVDATLE